MEPINDGTNAAPAAAPQPSAAPTEQPTAAATSDNSTLMGVLAYIGILVIIPFLTSRNDPFVKFHIKQGVVLVVIEIVLYVIGSMVWMLAPLLMFVNLGALVLSIIGIVNVIQKKQEPLPLVGKFAAHVNI